MNTVVWIVIAVVVVLLLIALGFALARKRRTQRRVEAGQIREEASHRVNDVQRREAIAEESAAKARRAQADAEAKAAEAKRLSHEAQTHHGVAASSREELDAEFQRADKIDPDVPHAGRHEGDRHEGNPVHEGNAPHVPGNAGPEGNVPRGPGNPVQGNVPRGPGNAGPEGNIPRGPGNPGNPIRPDHVDHNGPIHPDDTRGRHTP